jgi:hypothetical protein
MKFGVLVNMYNGNLGDDVQSYAASLFLPSVDCQVDRETIDTFESEDGGPVAVIMAAWWMRKKWNFPPARCIYPKLVSMHLTNFGVRKAASPIYDEFWQGVGGQYMNAFGPVGARDMHTKEDLEKIGIDAYFSGCVTLTLPSRPRVRPARDYICLVDLEPAVLKKMKSILKGADVDVRVMSNNRDVKRSRTAGSDWKTRKREVEELLDLYQNARCVVTRRLHVALPCLAMGVPVFVVFHKTNIRFTPYKDWLHMVSPDEFLAGDYEYDFLDPPPNMTRHLETRERLRADLEAWVVEAAGLDHVPVELPYTEEERMAWQYDLMKWTLNRWLPQSIKMVKDINRLSSSVPPEKGDAPSRARKHRGGAAGKVIRHMRRHGLAQTVRMIRDRLGGKD